MQVNFTIGIRGARVVIGSLALACMSAFGEDLNVTGSTTIGATAAYGKITVSGTLNVTGGNVTYTNMLLGGSASKYATANASGSGTIFGNNLDSPHYISKVLIGDNGTLGKLTVGGNATLRTYGVEVSSNAIPDPVSGTVDVVDIGPGTWSMSGILNQSKHTARVTFSGGELFLGQVWGANLILGSSGNNDPMTVFEGINGNSIRILTGGGDSGVHFNRLKTAGTCDLYLNATRHVYNSNLDMNHAGWVYIYGGGTINPNPYNDNTAFGTNVQGVTISGGTTVGLGSMFVRLQNLDVTNGVLTASAAKSVYFRGTGYFRGALPCILSRTDEGTTTIDAPSSAEKVNWLHGALCVKSEFESRGLLSFSSADDWRSQRMDVEAPVTAPSAEFGRYATLNVRSPLTISGTLTLASGAKLNVSSRLTVGSLVDNGATITMLDGGEIVYSDGTTAYSRGCRLVEGTYLKDGPTTMTVFDPTSFNGDICVKEGTLQFSTGGWTEKYWRLTITDVSAPSASTARLLWMCEIPFFSYAMRADDATNYYQHANYGLKAKPDLTAPADLPAGYAAFQCETKYDSSIAWYHDGKVDSYFNGEYNAKFPHLSSPTNDETHPLVIAMRLKDDAPAIYGYDMVHGYGYCRPKNWKLEASATGKDGEWTVVEVRSNETATSGFESYKGFRSSKAYAASCAFVLPLDTTKILPGVDNLPQMIGVRVDGGATLDFTNIKDGQGVSTLTIDADEGMGTLIWAKFAESGTLNLVNLPDGTKLTSLEFSPTLQHCSGMDYLQSWAVQVNGESSRYRAVYEDGKIKFSAPGLILLLK